MARVEERGGALRTLEVHLALTIAGVRKAKVDMQKTAYQSLLPGI